MEKKNKCELCKKERKEFQGFVWYSGSYGFDLCRSCYLKWCRSKERKDLEEKYNKAKPCTKMWEKKCEDLQKAFDIWFKKQSGGKFFSSQP
jgi:hypothetical protein